MVNEGRDDIESSEKTYRVGVMERGRFLNTLWYRSNRRTSLSAVTMAWKQDE